MTTCSLRSRGLDRLNDPPNRLFQSPASSAHLQHTCCVKQLAPASHTASARRSIQPVIELSAGVIYLLQPTKFRRFQSLVDYHVRNHYRVDGMHGCAAQSAAAHAKRTQHWCTRRRTQYIESSVRTGCLLLLCLVFVHVGSQPLLLRSLLERIESNCTGDDSRSLI